MEIRLLGTVEVHTDRGMLELGTPRQRSVLAALAVDARRVVPRETVIERVWGDVPPRRARDTLYVYIGRTRQALDSVDGGKARLVRRSSGYLLDAEVHEVDLHQFQALQDAARDPGCPDRPRAELLARSLALWRGMPLADLSGDWVDRVRQAWHRRRIGVATEWAQTLLRLGDAGAAIGPLTEMSAEYPLAESIAASLMNAMAAVGRGTEALDCYLAIRHRLADELGTDPGDQLRSAYQSILGRASSPGRAAQRPATPPTPRARAIPAQLPLNVQRFVGRRTELAQLDALAAADRSGAMVAVIAGTAGVGKTALAVHWSHLVADSFPDGQLFLNLRGFDPLGQAVDPAEALHRFLEALGVPSERIPADPDAKAALYRTEVAGRRMLVVLDNARDTGQVRPLLPGAPGCLVLVTSRSQLSGLVATDGAQLITLDLFAQAEARELLAHRLGEDRVTAETDAATEIITACARLPLALAIVAARAGAHPHIPLRSLASELSRSGGRLDGLTTTDDPATDVRAVFSWSYRILGPAAARLFRLLGLHPGPDFSIPAAASLAGVPVAEAAPLLAELTRTHLLSQHEPGRYTFHDLLREYAADLSRSTDSGPDRQAATHRILDHYLHSAHTADHLFSPGRDPFPLSPSQQGVTPEHLAGQDQALAWLTAEHAVLRALVDHAAATGFDLHARQLAWAMATFLDRRGHWHDCVTVQRTAVAAAHRLPDLPARAKAHRLLARAYSRTGSLDDAHTHLRHALDLHGEFDDPAERAHTHLTLGYVMELRGLYSQALDHAQQALDLFRANGLQSGQARALNAIGWDHALLGDHQQALDYCHQALAVNQELGDQIAQASTWDTIGYAHHHLGQLKQAAACYEQALSICRECGDRYNEADVLTHIGDNHRAAGDLDAARIAWLSAMDILAQLDHPSADEVRQRLQQS
ncbi:MAG TPA: BTAD domain-containing putative transcriptional regulator [Candidatus Limnocylindrales bacterium]